MNEFLSEIETWFQMGYTVVVMLNGMVPLPLNEDLRGYSGRLAYIVLALLFKEHMESSVTFNEDLSGYTGWWVDIVVALLCNEHMESSVTFNED